MEELGAAQSVDQSALSQRQQGKGWRRALVEDFEPRVGGELPGLGACKSSGGKVTSPALISRFSPTQEEAAIGAFLQDGSGKQFEAAGGESEGVDGEQRQAEPRPAQLDLLRRRAQRRDSLDHQFTCRHIIANHIDARRREFAAESLD